MFSVLKKNDENIERKAPSSFFKSSGQPAGIEKPFFAPSLKVSEFMHAANTNTPRGTDKSETESTEDQDQNANLTSLSALKSGVAITVNGEGLYSSATYPDGFRWTQTITTNANKGGPLLATPVTYVDPKPNDDTKPFYWTDGEEARHVAEFKDKPTRNPRAGGTVVWDAILSLNGVNGTDVQRVDSLTYGFEVSPAGVVDIHWPATPANVSGHLGILSSEFPGWSFS